MRQVTERFLLLFVNNVSPAYLAIQLNTVTFFLFTDEGRSPAESFASVKVEKKEWLGGERVSGRVPATTGKENLVDV